jgi:hypothetical protein
VATARENIMLKLLNYFYPRSVDGVMATFQKTVDDLKKVAQYQLTKVEQYECEIEDLLAKVDSKAEKQSVADEEAKAALDLSVKLTKAFGLNK